MMIIIVWEVHDNNRMVLIFSNLAYILFYLIINKRLEYRNKLLDTALPQVFNY